MDLSDSSWVTDTEIRMIYLFSVITVPLGFQNDIIYTGTGLQAGGGLDGFAIWRHAVRSLGWSRGSLSRFKLLSSNSSECSENQHLPQHETKGKYGKTGNRGGHQDDPSPEHHFSICQHTKKTRWHPPERASLRHETNVCSSPGAERLVLNKAFLFFSPFFFFFCF